MTVTVLFFGPASTLVGRDREAIELEEGASLTALTELLFERYPKLASAGRSLRFGVNEAYAGEDLVLRAGDEVAVIPPVSGGAGDGLVRIVQEPIRPEALIDHVKDASCGAVVTFQGDVRAEGGGNPLTGLEYQAYGPMALGEMHKIREAALKRFTICDVAIVHRVGWLEIGETSVAIAVGAPHRAEALDACRFVIDTLKVTVPIWKKNVYAGGGSEWVDPTGETRDAAGA